jgi:alpha/beta hydrolase fold
MGHSKVLKGDESNPKQKGFLKTIQVKFRNKKGMPHLFKVKAPNEYHIKNVDGVDIFYREAGQKEKPTLVLLHGFSTSSYLYKDLIEKLSNEYHIIAPDYPGYGDSEEPSFSDFEYTLESYAKILSQLLSTLDIKKYSLYLMDSGIPIGYGMESLDPEKILSLIIQSDCSHKEDSESFWNPFNSYWNDKEHQKVDVLHDESPCSDSENMRYYYNSFKSNTILSDNWGLDLKHLLRFKSGDNDLALFYDYQNFLKLNLH